MFLFSKDLKILGPSDIAKINKAQGTRHMASEAAIAKAEMAKSLSPRVASVLAEHPDERVPLALLSNTKLAWKQHPMKVLLTTLEHRATAEAQDKLWTPLLDAVADRTVDRWQYERVQKTGYHKAHWNQPIPASAEGDFYLKGHYAQGQRLDKWFVEAIARFNNIYVDESTFACARAEYRSLTFWRNILPIRPEALGTDLVDVCRVNIPLAAMGMGKGPMLPGTYWGVIDRIIKKGSSQDRDTAISGYFQSSEVRLDVVKKIVEALQTQCIWTADYALRDAMEAMQGREDYEEMIDYAISQAIKHMKTAGYSYTLKKVAGDPGLTAARAKLILAASPSSRLRENMAKGAAKSNAEIAGLLGKSQNRRVHETISTTAEPDSFVAALEGMAKTSPNVAAEGILQRGDGVINKIARKQIAPIMARGDAETRSKMMGTLSKLR